jgi:hypothetical protein
MTRHEPPAATLSGATTGAFDQLGGQIEAKAIANSDSAKRTAALDLLRLEALADMAEIAADLAADTVNAARAGNSLAARLRLTMLSRAVSNALGVAAGLGNAEARA